MAGVLVIGSSNTDYVCRAPRIPAPGETIAGRSFQTFAGGKGANQAVAAARAGAQVIFVGAHGDDRIGIDRRADLIAEGIDISHFRALPGVTSGVASIIVADSGQNQIVYVPGANAQIRAADAIPALAASDYDVLSMTFEAPFDTVEFALRNRREGSLAVLNAAPFDSRLPGLLPLIDVLICNEVEASAIAWRQVDPDSAEEVAVELTMRGLRAVVITLGEHGAVTAGGGDAWWTSAPSVEVVDTTGAGDAFCGACCAWLAEGHSLRQAVRAGVAAGSLSVTEAGAQPSLPNRDEIQRQLDSTPGS
jgi:ribokinase